MELDLHEHHEPSDCPEVLAQLAEERLRELNLVAQGSAGRIGGNETARLKPSGAPPMRTDDLVGKYTRDFEAARSNAARLRVLKQIQDEITRQKYAPVPARRRGTLDWKLQIALDPRPSHVTAEDFGIGASYVRKIRKAYRDGKLAEVSDSDA